LLEFKSKYPAKLRAILIEVQFGERSGSGASRLLKKPPPVSAAKAGSIDSPIRHEDIVEVEKVQCADGLQI